MTVHRRAATDDKGFSAVLSNASQPRFEPTKPPHAHRWIRVAHGHHVGRIRSSAHWPCSPGDGVCRRPPERGGGQHPRRGQVLWLGTNKLSQKAKNLRGYRSCGSPERRSTCRVRPTSPTTWGEKRRLWEGNLFRYDPAMFFGSVDNPDFLLVRIEPRTAAVRSMGEHGPATRRWKA